MKRERLVWGSVLAVLVFVVVFLLASSSDIRTARRMKAGREHRVPLCGRAVEILDAARTLTDGDSPIVFVTERGESLDEKRMCRAPSV